jgi:hypothetical protein
MKRYLALAIVILFTLGFAGLAMAAGNFYIPGSRDIEGGLGADGKSFEKLHIGNRVVMEGSTSDAYETTIFATEPTADRTITLQDASGTVAYTGASPVGATLTDAKILIGNSAGTATEQSLTASGDATGTLTNAGALALTQAANSIGVLQANINTVTLLVANTTSTNSVTVDSTATLMSYYITTLGGVNGANLINDLYYEGSGVWTISMVNALVGGDAVWTLKFLQAD